MAASTTATFLLNDAGCCQLGLALLRETLVTASFTVTGATNGMWNGIPRTEVTSESVALMNGTGLEILLAVWGVPLRAERIRDAFGAWAHRHKSRS